MVTVKEKLAAILDDLPDSVVTQIYYFARFLQIEMDEDCEMRDLEQSPAFNRLAVRFMRDLENGETLTLDELKNAIGD